MSAVIAPGGVERDCLWVVIEASLRIRKRHQLFGWSQGVLQSVLPHDVLLCGLVASTPATVRGDVVAAAHLTTDELTAIRAALGPLVTRLTRIWEAGDLQPFVAVPGGTGPATDAVLHELMVAAGLRNLAAHGTFDRHGQPTALYVFAQFPDPPGAREISALELVVPYLHTAFLRVHLDGQAAARPRRSSNELTGREIEILRCLQGGRSNSDIGRQLGISPLTVKNHVQKILRKLRAQNRTEAVAKGLSMEILQVGAGGRVAAGEVLR